MKEEGRLSKEAIGAAIEAHCHLGLGLPTRLQQCHLIILKIWSAPSVMMRIKAVTWLLHSKKKDLFLTCEKQIS